MEEDGKRNTQKREFNWEAFLPRRDADPLPKLLVSTTAGAAKRKQSSAAMDSILYQPYVRNELSGLTDTELDKAIRCKNYSYNTVGKNLRDKGGKILKELKSLRDEKERRKRRPVEKENSVTVNAFPKTAPGVPLCDSSRNGQLSPRQKIKLKWEEALLRDLRRRDDDPLPELLFPALKRKRSSVAMGRDQPEHSFRKEFSVMTEKELEAANMGSKESYNLVAEKLQDKGEKLLRRLNGRKRSRVEKENSVTVNEFPKTPTGVPLCDSRRNGQLSPRDRSKTFEGHKISSRTENPSKGSPFHTSPIDIQSDDDDDLDCAMGEHHVANPNMPGDKDHVANPNMPGDKDETRVEEDSTARVTSCPRLAQVVEEMQTSLTRMQSQVDRMAEQVGGFSQRLEAYDDHFAAMRRRLDYYFPWPPPGHQ